MSIIWKSKQFLPLYRPLFNTSASYLNTRLQRDERPTFCEPPKPILSYSQTRNFSFAATASTIAAEISGSPPVAVCQQGLIQLHELTGLPWWATIVLNTVLLRTVITFPLAIYQNKILARLELIYLEMNDIVIQLKHETNVYMAKNKVPEQQMRVFYNRSLDKQLTKLILRDNCHPMKTSVVLWAQIPFWICQSFAIRNLLSLYPDPLSIDAHIIFTSLSVGGFGWIPNLTEVDASYILPVTLGLVNLTIIEISSMTRTTPPGKIQKCVTWLFRGFSIVMIPIAASVPSCLTLYWTTSSLAALSQNLAFMSPIVKRLVGIPAAPSHLANPYQHLAAKIVYRIHTAKDNIQGFLDSKR